MKKAELHPELLDIDRMRSKAPTKKELEEISAFIKKTKEIQIKIKGLKKKKSNTVF
jgi:hypothetical protein